MFVIIVLCTEPTKRARLDGGHRFSKPSSHNQIGQVCQASIKIKSHSPFTQATTAAVVTPVSSVNVPEIPDTNPDSPDEIETDIMDDS